MLSRLICPDQALLKDLTRNFTTQDNYTSLTRPNDETFNEQEMIKRYY